MDDAFSKWWEKETDFIWCDYCNHEINIDQDEWYDLNGERWCETCEAMSIPENTKGA